ncbi:N-acetyltransferase [Fulvitalea axinellae]|uniref:N-acetyltransferase n=1 Tax=Fulvitalea axinellae TaxID=1182444 RepID=A0AAU9CIP6_9BACT|nr:N-acetyltransferase [Fulvitalea axinellae]
MREFKIRLESLGESHRASFYPWVKDEEAVRYSLSAFQRMKTDADTDKWFDGVLSEKGTVNKAVVLHDTDVCVGYAGLCKMSKANKSAEYFIFIGDRSNWGKGIGSLVTKMILNIGFGELGLNRITLTVSEPNVWAVKAYRRSGFQMEGRLRQACLRDGEYHDKFAMSILRDEWEKQNHKNIHIC